jgi:hypothetical protein
MGKEIYLVGNTGFVGSNLIYAYPYFTKVANSKNISKMYGDSPDILIYAGVTGTKWYANLHEQEDKEIIQSAIKNIKNIAPKKLVLISTVDVFDGLDKINEDHFNDINKLHIYGKHRLELEKWVIEHVDDYHIVRLPAIYGKNLKKNFVYDLIHFIPEALNQKKMDEVLDEVDRISGNRNRSNGFDYEIFDSTEIISFYELDGSGIFHLKNINKDLKVKLRRQFMEMKSNALMFTNSKSEYQFYNLAWLWEDLRKIIYNDIHIITLATEPIAANELFEYIYNRTYENNESSEIRYNLWTKYARILNGNEHYIYDKDFLINDLKKFVQESTKSLTDEI